MEGEEAEEFYADVAWDGAWCAAWSEGAEGIVVAADDVGEDLGRLVRKGILNVSELVTRDVLLVRGRGLWRPRARLGDRSGDGCLARRGGGFVHPLSLGGGDWTSVVLVANVDPG